MTGSTERAAAANAPKVPEAPEPAAGMSRKTPLRRAGLGIGTVLVVGSGAIGYRAYDQGVLEVVIAVLLLAIGALALRAAPRPTIDG